MMRINLPVKIINCNRDGTILLKSASETDIFKLRAFVQHYRATSSNLFLTLSDRQKKRSTGKNSQNAKLHGLIRIIATDTGNSFDSVKYEVKRRAMNEMGYPYARDEDGGIIPNPFNGEPAPQSEAECSIAEAALLIEAAYVIGAELGIVLP